MIRLRAETPSTSHPLPQLTSSPHCSVQSSRPHDKTGPRLHYPPLKSIGWNTEMQLQRAEGSSSIGLESLMVCRPERGSVEEKMALKRRTTRLNPGATPTLVPNTHTTTSVTNAQIQAMIDEGVTVALAARDATRNGDNIHTSGTGARMPVQVARKCTYREHSKMLTLKLQGH
ncbi:hypothetical protein Tco_0657822 [Tanacetum coccineum]